MDGGCQRIIVGWGQDLGVTVKTDSKPSDGQSHKRGRPPSIYLHGSVFTHSP